MPLIYFILVHLTLLIPGYVAIKNSKLLAGKPGLELCAAYSISIVGLAGLAVAGYALDLPQGWLQGGAWALIGASFALFFQQRLYRGLAAVRFPLVALVAMSVFSCTFIGLTFSDPHTFIPDPQYREGQQYDAFNVKVLNVAHTNANDNYIPYRQAQFMVNRSDPATDSFIDEWGVHFFQRTPLMGAVSAQYFNLLGDQPPIGYTWNADSQDPDGTYLKFQIIAHILNALFILPAFFLLAYFFKRRAALVAVLFLIPSHFFLFNAFFTWPKSLVAFFILFSWLLLVEKRLRYLVLAAAASGVAYLAHDLAVLYIGASVLALLYWKRIKDIFVFGAASAVFAVPWLIASSFVYHKQSTFFLYPFSVHDIPQADAKTIFRQFFDTSPLRHIAIRLESLFFLLSPYQLIYRGGQEIVGRIWAAGIFSVPGAIGFGMIFATLWGAIKRIRDVPFWIFALAPIVLCVLLIGWPKGMGALHFAQVSVVLLVGLGAWALTKFKNKLWALIAYAANAVQTVLFGLYSYNFGYRGWFSSPSDIVRVVIRLAIIGLCGWAVFAVVRNKMPRPLRGLIAAPRSKSTP